MPTKSNNGAVAMAEAAPKSRRHMKPRFFLAVLLCFVMLGFGVPLAATNAAAAPSGPSVHVNGPVGYTFEFDFSRAGTTYSFTVTIPASGMAALTDADIIRLSGTEILVGDELVAVKVWDTHGTLVRTMDKNDFGHNGSGKLLETPGIMGPASSPTAGQIVSNPGGNINFTYTIPTASAPVSLTASKVASGAAMSANQFTFTVTDSKGNVVATGHNAAGADGVAAAINGLSFNFNGDAVDYTDPANQDQEYKVVETTPSANGWDTSTATFTVDIKIVQAPGSSALTVTVQSISPSPIRFIDAYTGFTDDITVTKAWDDNGDAAGKRPSDVTVRLYGDGSDTGFAVTLDSSNGWTDTFSKVPEFEADGSTPVDYTVVEDPVANYSPDIQPADLTNTGAFDITNTYVPPKVVTDFPFTVNYYQDSLGGRLLKSVPSAKTYPTGTALNAALVASDLGAGWLDAYRPAGYNGGTAAYAVAAITADSSKNIVNVVYTANSKPHTTGGGTSSGGTSPGGTSPGPVTTKGPITGPTITTERVITEPPFKPHRVTEGPLIPPPEGPKTGDPSTPGFWLILLLASGTVIIAATALARRYRPRHSRK